MFNHNILLIYKTFLFLSKIINGLNVINKKSTEFFVNIGFKNKIIYKMVDQMLTNTKNKKLLTI